MKFPRLLLVFLPLGIALILSSCEEYPTPPGPGTQAATAAAAPTPVPTPAGQWYGAEGASGEPRIIVHLHQQKAFFYKGKTLVGESTVSTGKPGFSTPPGHYTVVSKDKDHVSSEFGDYVDNSGYVVKANIDVRKDSRPKGTHFDGAKMPYCMHFNGGYAMHQGYVPPYAASHGCIRLPKEMASYFYNAAPIGTTLVVKQE